MWGEWVGLSLLSSSPEMLGEFVRIYKIRYETYNESARLLGQTARLSVPRWGSPGRGQPSCVCAIFSNIHSVLKKKKKQDSKLRIFQTVPPFSKRCANIRKYFKINKKWIWQQRQLFTCDPKTIRKNIPSVHLSELYALQVNPYFQLTFPPRLSFHFSCLLQRVRESSVVERKC